MRNYWPWLRDGLDRIRAKVHCEWIPEDVYVSLRSGVSTAFVIGADEGFIVLNRQERPRGPCLFVWIVEGNLARYERELYDWLEQMAREVKAPTIEMHSPRMGWARRGFFEPRETVYIREVSE